MREALVVCATTYGIDDLREEQKASPLANISQQDHVNLPFSETRIMFLDLFDLSCLSLFENGDLALIRIQEPTALESCRTAQVSKIGFGCMGLSGIYSSPVPDEDVVAIIKTAFDAGVTFFDTGDAYWPHNNEDMLGKGAWHPSCFIQSIRSWFLFWKSSYGEPTTKQFAVCGS
ncbi:uncharacterized protein LOC133904133 isoform X3 [Phragmites australis]|uniref:uncharacterized protein LOC133904133 isoform X3 n=1 Tax=Phragmites australis TaxID=29695 RepID=UPI002D7885A8|nr:uncharacterized protein LOC133904133 isoform X3 [Phragmites australis]